MFVAPLAGSPPVGMTPTDGRLVMGGIFQIASQLVAGGGYTASASVLQLTVNQAVFSLTDVTNASAVFFTPTDATTLTFAAAPGSGGRIDLVVVKQNNVENGDADSRVNITVVTGTASGSPVAPAVPAGASKYLAVLINAGVTNAAAATITNYMQTQFADPPLQAPTQAALYASPGIASQIAVVTSDGANNGIYWYNGTNWAPTSTRVQTVSTSTPTQNSITTTPTTVTGLTVTTVLAGTQKLRVKGTVQVYSSNAGDVVQVSVLDGATVVQSWSLPANSSSGQAATSMSNYFEGILSGVASGSHTYTVQLTRVAGTGSVTTAPSALSNNWLAVEVIG